ncbi:MAG: DUF4271 domain-containing protein [Bacteroidales bacterium]|nr:DUF4271 domain-containing protein [Bacteroidales bacterium]
MNNNSTIYCWQIDTAAKEIKNLKTVADSISVAKPKAKLEKTSKFVPYDYSYYASPVVASDSIFASVDTAANSEEYGYISLDSIFKAGEREVEQHKSILLNHNYPRESYREATNVPSYFPAWVFAILAVGFLIISWVFNSSRIRVHQILKGCLNQRNLNLLFHEGNVMKDKIIYPIMLVFIAFVALFVYGVMNVYDIPMWHRNHFLNYMIVLLLTAAFIVVKQGLESFLGNVFKNKIGTIHYLANNMCHYFLEAICMLPLLFFLFYVDRNYAEIVVYITTFVLVLVSFYRLFRGFSLILVGSKLSQLYLFYYLCIVEIVPFLVAIKLVLF